MWWKRFIGSPIGISALPRERLEHLYVVSDEQIQKMQSQESALRSEINDITVETTRQLSMAQQTSIIVDCDRDEVCPANYSASERRCHQLRAQISQLMADREQIDSEIYQQEDVLQQYIELHQIEQPVPKESLLVGPFNNTDLRKIYNQLTLLSRSAQTKSDREDITFCLDVLSGESKKLAKRMEQMKDEFGRSCIEKQEELDSLITEATKYQRLVQKLHDQMEALTKKSEMLRPILPSVRKDLQNEIKSMGDTKTQLREINNEVQKLRERKEELKNECQEISDEILLRPLDDVARRNEMNESVELRQKKTNFEIELHELEQTRNRLESTIASGRESIQDCINENQEMINQCEQIKKATDKQRWKFEKFSLANVTTNDIAFIRMWSRKMSPDELEKSIETLKDGIKLFKKRKINMMRRKEQFIEQEKQYQKQIDEMRELLQQGNIKDEDLPE